MRKQRVYRELLHEIANTEKKKPLYKKLETIRKRVDLQSMLFIKK